MIKKLKIAVLIFVGLFVAIQFVPVNRDNPPVTADVGAPEPVASILRRSCYDCHSNETAWPLYSKIAPVAWQVARDVHEGRKHLNFSEWGNYSADDQEAHLYIIRAVIEEGMMPPWFYLPAHPDALLCKKDKEKIYAWIEESLP